MTSKFNFWFLFIVLSFATAAAEKAKTEIVKDGEKFSLYINGVEVYLKGINGPESSERAALAANYGANAVRIYCHGPNETEWAIQRAYWAAQQNMYAVLYWDYLSMNAADYTEEYKNRQKMQIRDFAERLKDIPNVFMITIGNEMDHSKGTANIPATYQFINELALIVKSVCPDKLVSTSICSSGDISTLSRIADNAPDLDVLCLNIYAELTDLLWIETAVKSSNWKGAYFISEWGDGAGHWNAPKTTWGASIEKTSEEKRASIENLYNKVFKNQSQRCLGTFFFIWGSYWEYTPTWFSVFVEKNASVGINGEQSATADALHQCWKGTVPAQTAPVVTAITIDGTPPASSIKVSANTNFTCSVTATDKEQSSLAYKWEILKDTGKSNARPGIVKSTNTNTTTFSVPETGNYRLYVYVLDGTGRVGTANTPFQVQ